MKEWAWVRTKTGEDGNFLIPFTYELLIGERWGDNKSRHVSDHTELRDAARLADFFNKANGHIEES